MLLILVGVAVLILAIVGLVDTQKFFAKAKTTKGTIVEMLFQEDGDGGLYYSVVKFTAQDGNTYMVKNKIGSKPALHDVGDEVTVYYDPLKPTDITIGRSSVWIFLLAIAGMGFFSSVLVSLPSR